MSLLEILASLAFISLAVLSVFAIQTLLARGSAKTATREHALAVATALIDLRERELSGNLDSSVSSAVAPVPVGLQVGDRPFTYSVEDAVLGSVSDRLKSLKVTVYWEDSTGRQSLELVTKVTDD